MNNKVLGLHGIFWCIIQIRQNNYLILLQFSKVDWSLVLLLEFFQVRLGHMYNYGRSYSVRHGFWIKFKPNIFGFKNWNRNRIDGLVSVLKTSIRFRLQNQMKMKIREGYYNLNKAGLIKSYAIQIYSTPKHTVQLTQCLKIQNKATISNGLMVWNKK